MELEETFFRRKDCRLTVHAGDQVIGLWRPDPVWRAGTVQMDPLGNPHCLDGAGLLVGGKLLRDAFHVVLIARKDNGYPPKPEVFLAHGKKRSRIRQDDLESGEVSDILQGEIVQPGQSYAELGASWRQT